MFPDSTERGSHFRRRFARKAKPKSRRCLPTSRSRRYGGIQHARTVGKSGRHGTSPADSGGTARATIRARNRRRHLRSEGERSGRTHQRRGREGLRQKHCFPRRPRRPRRRRSAGHFAQPQLPDFAKVGQDRTRVHARSPPQNCRASCGSVEHDSSRHAA